jgi:hypothetical protein
MRRNFLKDMAMSDSTPDAGVIQALIERLDTQRLPRALELKKRVDAGEPLGEPDLRFLDEVFRDTQSVQPILGRHPEYQPLVARIIHLYKEILDKAMENEKKS